MKELIERILRAARAVLIDPFAPMVDSIRKFERLDNQKRIRANKKRLEYLRGYSEQHKDDRLTAPCDLAAYLTRQEETV